MTTQLQEALHIRHLRDQAIAGKSETLRILYEQAAENYEKQYNEKPWLIIARESLREK